LYKPSKYGWLIAVFSGLRSIIICSPTSYPPFFFGVVATARHCKVRSTSASNANSSEHTCAREELLFGTVDVAVSENGYPQPPKLIKRPSKMWKIMIRWN